MKEVVEKKIVATFEKCKARGVDVYELFDKLYEKSFKDFKNESPNGDYLNRIRLIVNAKISVVKNSCSDSRRFSTTKATKQRFFRPILFRILSAF